MRQTRRLIELVTAYTPDFCWQTAKEIVLMVEAFDDEFEFIEASVMQVCNILTKRGVLEKREILNRTLLAGRSHKGSRGKFPKFEYRKRPPDTIGDAA